MKRASGGGLAVAASLLLSTAFTLRTVFLVQGRPAVTLFDDAMISMRYARNLADGLGLTWNAGWQPVEGYSNFLWTLWMSLLHFLRLPDRGAALPVIATGALLLALNVLAVRAVARQVAPEAPFVAAASGWATALYYPLVYWTLRGMEVGLIALLLSGTLLLALRAGQQGEVVRVRSMAAIGALLAALLLTRDDTVVAAGIIIGFLLLRVSPRRLVLTFALGLPAAALVGHLLLRLSYYGLPLPNTYYLKVQGFPLAERAARGIVVVTVMALQHLLLPVVLATVLLVLRWRRLAPGVVLLFLLVAGQLAYVVYVGGDAWEWFEFSDRYLAPVVPYLFVLAGLGATAFLEGDRLRHPVALAGGMFVVAAALNLSRLLPVERIQLPPSPSRMAPSVVIPLLSSVAAVAVALLWKRSGARWSAAGPLLMAVTIASVGVLPYARWLRGNAALWSDDVARARYGTALRACTPPTATIAVGAAGNIPYFDHRPSVDVLGKTDHVIATRPPRSGRFLPGHNKLDYTHSVAALRPEILGEMFFVTPADAERFAAWGYRRVGDANVWYLPGEGVDPTRLVVALNSVQAHPPSC